MLGETPADACLSPGRSRSRWVDEGAGVALGTVKDNRLGVLTKLIRGETPKA